MSLIDTFKSGVKNRTVLAEVLKKYPTEQVQAVFKNSKLTKAQAAMTVRADRRIKGVTADQLLEAAAIMHEAARVELHRRATSLLRQTEKV